jgi:hypothetical protein
MNRNVPPARRVAAVAAILPPVFLGACALPASATYEEGEWCEDMQDCRRGRS